MRVVPKETQSAKLAKFQDYIARDCHLQGSIGYKSHRMIAEDLDLCTYTVSRYLKLHYPQLDYQMRKKRSLV